MISDQYTRVLVLVPTLGIGGAEMDLVRNLPRIDRNRFEIIVYAFLARGTLSQPLMDAGIEVIGPVKLFPWLPAAKQVVYRLAARVVKWFDPLLRQFGRKAIAFAWKSLPTQLHRLAMRVIKYLPGRARQFGRRTITFIQFSIRSVLAIPYALLRSVGSARDYLRISIAVAKLLRERKIDVVHAILPNAYLTGSIATLLARRGRIVMSRLSLNWYQAQLRLLGMIERHVLHRLVDVVICNSAAIQQNLLWEGLSQSKIRLIPNGINLEVFPNLDINREWVRDQLGIPQGALVFSVVASLYSYKGHDDLLRALALVRDRLPRGWKLIAAGRDVDGNLARMQTIANELGLANHVRFLGERSDIALILRGADIHVSASHTEGFPNNILEAMFAGLPVIATRVGGVPEMVIDGQTGLLLTARNSDEMAQALLRLGHDPGLCASMGKAGRLRVASYFLLERSVGGLQEVYATVGARCRPSLLHHQHANSQVYIKGDRGFA